MNKKLVKIMSTIALRYESNDYTKNDVGQGGEELLDDFRNCASRPGELLELFELRVRLRWIASPKISHLM